MKIDVMISIMAASAVTLASSAHADSCPPGLVSVNLTSVDDVREFVDALRCTGEGVFDVTWNGRLQIDQRIEISGRKNVTVTGSHGTTSDSTSDDHAVIDAGETTGIFLVTNMSTLALHYLHLEGGLSEYDGGAVEMKSSSSLYVFGCDFTNNKCSEGGVIAADRSDIYIDGITYFGRNAADFGGAIYAYGSRIDINGRAQFVDNSASENGGAIFSAGRSTLSIGRSTIFTGNAAQSQGGAIFFDEPNEVNVSDVVFTSNTADCGGAIYMASPAYSSVREYRNCMFEDNTATNGGAIYLYDEAGLDIVNGSTFYGNYARTSGGAIYLAGILEVYSSNFTANRAGDEGMAIASVCASSRVRFGNVGFWGNALYCPLGQYATYESLDNVSTFVNVCKGCSADKTAIPDGVSVDSQTPVCKELPKGTDARSGGTTTETLTLAAGYYRPFVWVEDMLECYRPEACTGGQDPDKYCAIGYQGACEGTT